MAKTVKNIPVIRPNPPRLSEHVRELKDLEDSGIFSNFGPVNQRFEQELADTIFGTGQCLTVCNATIGLMVALRHVLGEDRPREKRYALMPSFTFAAVAHAALWNGLTPLFCDIDRQTWLPSAEHEEELLKKHQDEIAVVVPYATFGNNLDLRRYDELSERFGVPIVVDAAASLGALDAYGKGFGSGFRWPVVFSMHATKTFATGEGGVIYCADVDRVKTMRAMCSFGFEAPRVATLPGLNGKLSEVSALTALLQLNRFEAVVEHRRLLSEAYRHYLPGWDHQESRGKLQSFAFQSVLLEESLTPMRTEVVELLRARGIGVSTYFSPHLAKQPYFSKYGVGASLEITQNISERILTLPMFDTMTDRDVQDVASDLIDIVSQLEGKATTDDTCQVIEAKSSNPEYVEESLASNKS
ncbi:DegT/DnrJ/EryC1/StrS family aminotransferase [Tunturiibacter lichenicola]|uniref:DegT/DnrJ/EryC1/StrS family aminotransferase n=1 Tax=Tunturiibacter lichenicola TaxID=2051959 RepID=UPI0021B17191|nr:DegT/DnrJ/EryC1/StrS family aminotransferase [Edaphobacter lichenicola]